ncbi:MAG: hypothetical protein HY372_01015 [Candidatus Andersenbacteria bacterium]|nr:hypothetical protein [Candidatus Andersenbacteria bacterium]
MQILNLLRAAAHEAGDFSRFQQSTAEVVVKKGSEHDIATSADLDAGSAIEELLRLGLPQYSVVTEENRSGLPPEEFRTRRQEILNNGTAIVVDDLDASFVYKSSVTISGKKYGGENYGHIIGLVQNRAVTHCVMYLPLAQVLIAAKAGEGCFVNGDRHRIPAGKTAANSLFYLVRHQDIPASFDEMMSHIIYGLKPGGYVCLNSNIGGLARVALGEFGAFVGAGKIWDYTGLLAVQEAGGFIASADGQPFNWSRIPQVVIAAANQEIGEAILAITKQYPSYQQHFWDNPKFQS